MSPAPLAATLFTAPPPPGNERAPADSTGAASDAHGQSAFSRLLDHNEGSTASAPGMADEPTADSALAAADANSEPSVEAATDDAPWPPPGLETLITVAVPVTAPVATSASPIGTDSLLRLSAGNDAAAAPTLSVPATLATTVTTTAAAAAPAQALAAGNPGTTAALALGQNSIDDSLEQVLAGPQTALSPAPSALVEPGSISLLAGLNAISGVNPPPAHNAPTTLLPGTAELAGEHFDADVAQGVEYMLDNKLQSARIRISPQQLGMIEVELRLEGERVHASFSSAHADVRLALSESLPRLREMLDAQGLQMGQTAVGDSPSGQPRDGQAGAGAQHAAASGNDAPGQATAPPPAVWRHHRLLDTYA